MDDLTYLAKRALFVGAASVVNDFPDVTKEDSRFLEKVAKYFESVKRADEFIRYAGIKRKVPQVVHSDIINLGEFYRFIERKMPESKSEPSYQKVLDNQITLLRAIEKATKTERKSLVKFLLDYKEQFPQSDYFDDDE